MMRKWYWFFIFAVAVVLGFPTTAQAAKAYSADRFDVDIAVQPGGALNITETIVFRFEGGPFRFVFRELEYRQLDSIENIRVYLDGKLLPEGTGEGQVEIEQGRPLKITWHFAPTTDETHEYRLEYTVLGAVRHSDTANEIFWRAIPESHEYTIDSSRIRVQYPAGLEPLAAPRLTGGTAAPETGPGTATFNVFNIEEDQALDVQVSFPPGSLIAQPPAWQARAEQLRSERRAALPFGAGAALAVLALGGVLLASSFARARGEEATPLSFSSQQQTPPSEIPPGLAAKLTGSGDAAMATLFDLARRRVLQIEMSHGFLNSKQFALMRMPTNEDLRPHEQGLLQALFEDRHGWRDRLTFTEMGSLLASRRKYFDQPLDEELTRYGWIDPERKARRRRWTTMGMLVFAGGLLLFLIGLLPFGALVQAVMIGSGIGLFVIGLLAVILGQSYSPYSPVGQQQAAAWRSFANYLKDITRGREVTVRPDSFDVYLPFAAGFGLAAAWARFFERQQNVPVPEWLASLQAAGGDFSDVTAAIVASQAAQSSASSGGGGASGGGSSGAG